MRSHDVKLGVQTTKTTIPEAVNHRFNGVQCEHFILLATMLDARYKDQYFDGEKKRSADASTEDPPREEDPNRITAGYV